jgi:hypothetical protein
MPYDVNNDVRIYYETEGNGPPLLFTHGLTSSHQMCANMAMLTNSRTTLPRSSTICVDIVRVTSRMSHKRDR